MSYELDYFTEFLKNPSAVSLGEFYRMLNLWGEYLQEHKGEFNYLEDDEWKEIRERLLAEFPKREELKAEIDDEWQFLGEMFERVDELTDEENLDVVKRQINLLKNYQDYFRISDETIAEAEEQLVKFEKSIEEAKIAEENLRISEENLEKSIADLDEALLKAEEKTGKTPHIHLYQGAKHHKGN